jgi:ChaB
MPQSRRYRRDDGLPATLRRSCVEAQEAFTRAYNEAVRAYGEGDQAYRAAFTALKRKFEKRGDHWIPRREPED